MHYDSCARRRPPLSVESSAASSGAVLAAAVVIKACLSPAATAFSTSRAAASLDRMGGELADDRASLMETYEDHFAVDIYGDIHGDIHDVLLDDWYLDDF